MCLPGPFHAPTLTLGPNSARGIQQHELVPPHFCDLWPLTSNYEATRVILSSADSGFRQLMDESKSTLAIQSQVELATAGCSRHAHEQT